MTKSNSRIRRVKGWAIMYKRPLVDEPFSITFPIYKKRKDAEQTKAVYYLRHYRVLPCTISYTLPTKPKH